MEDIEKVIRGLEHCADRTNLSCNPTCPYHERDFCNQELAQDALELLKEQDDCENCAIAIEDRQPVVRCKDCKHRPELKLYSDKYGEDYAALEFPDGSKCPCQCEDFFCSRRPKDDWFCADGVAKDNYVPDKEGR